MLLNIILLSFSCLVSFSYGTLTCASSPGYYAIWGQFPGYVFCCKTPNYMASCSTYDPLFYMAICSDLGLSDARLCPSTCCGDFFRNSDPNQVIGGTCPGCKCGINCTTQPTNKPTTGAPTNSPTPMPSKAPVLSTPMPTAEVVLTGAPVQGFTQSPTTNALITPSSSTASYSYSISYLIQVIVFCLFLYI